MNFYQKVYINIRKIPEGKVATYGQIAAMSGSERAAQQVGWALFRVDDATIPWQRVVGKGGYLTIANPSFPATLQKDLLEKEGLEIEWDKERELYKLVDIEKHLWQPA